MELTPALYDVFSVLLCQEDATNADNFIVKDISLLTHNREMQDIFVVNTVPATVQTDYLASIYHQPYDGLINYTQLAKVV